MVKHGEITSPMLTAVLAQRIKTYRETQYMFPGLARPLQLNDRELQVIEQSLRLATRAMEATKPC